MLLYSPETCEFLTGCFSARSTSEWQMRYLLLQKSLEVFAEPLLKMITPRLLPPLTFKSESIGREQQRQHKCHRRIQLVNKGSVRAKGWGLMHNTDSIRYRIHCSRRTAVAAWRAAGGSREGHPGNCLSREPRADGLNGAGASRCPGHAAGWDRASGLRRTNHPNVNYSWVYMIRQ